MKVKDMFRYVCLCVLVMASGRVMAAEAQGLRPVGRKDPKVETKKMLGKPIKSFCGYEFGSPLVTKKGFDPKLAKSKSRYRKFTECSLEYEQGIGLCRITAYARLGKVKAEALAVMKDFTTKYGAVFEKSEPSDGPEGFQIAGRIPVSSKGLSVDNISKGLSFANICISGSGRGILTVDIEPQRLKGKVSSKLTDAEIAEIRKEELAQEQFMREYEREKEREEEKKNREEEEVLKKMKAFVVSKFEMRQSKTILDFIEFAVREKSGINFSFVSNKSKPRKVPTVDFSVESMTLFDVLEKMVKDGKVTYQLSGSIVILRVP